MTVNTKIYNKENLKEDDRKELDFWADIIEKVIDNTEMDYEVVPGILGQIQTEVIGNFVEELKKMFGIEIMENVVGIIDGYEEEVEEIGCAETYYYEGE